MHDFSHEVMIPQLKALLGPTTEEIAIRDIYFKMYLFLGSAMTMNRLDHFQSVAALTRSLFELLLDMKILAADKTGDAVNRYNEFPEIERYRRAEQLIRSTRAIPIRSSRTSRLNVRLSPIRHGKCESQARSVRKESILTIGLA